MRGQTFYDVTVNEDMFNPVGQLEYEYVIPTVNVVFITRSVVHVTVTPVTSLYALPLLLLNLKVT